MIGVLLFSLAAGLICAWGQTKPSLISMQTFFLHPISVSFSAGNALLYVISCKVNRIYQKRVRRLSRIPSYLPRFKTIFLTSICLQGGTAVCAAFMGGCCALWSINHAEQSGLQVGCYYEIKMILLAILGAFALYMNYRTQWHDHCLVDTDAWDAFRSWWQYTIELKGGRLPK